MYLRKKIFASIFLLGIFYSLFIPPVFAATYKVIENDWWKVTYTFTSSYGMVYDATFEVKSTSNVGKVEREMSLFGYTFTDTITLAEAFVLSEEQYQQASQASGTYSGYSVSNVMVSIDTYSRPALKLVGPNQGGNTVTFWIDSVSYLILKSETESIPQ